MIHDISLDLQTGITAKTYDFTPTNVLDVIEESQRIQTDTYWTHNAELIAETIASTRFVNTHKITGSPVNDWLDIETLTDITKQQSRRGTTIYTASTSSNDVYIVSTDNEKRNFPEVPMKQIGYIHAMLLGIPIPPVAFTNNSIITLAADETYHGTTMVPQQDMVDIITKNITLCDGDAVKNNHVIFNPDTIARIDITHPKMQLFRSLSTVTTLIPAIDTELTYSPLIELFTWRARQLSQTLIELCDAVTPTTRFEQRTITNLQEFHRQYHQSLPVTTPIGPLYKETMTTLQERGWPWKTINGNKYQPYTTNTRRHKQTIFKQQFEDF